MYYSLEKKKEKLVFYLINDIVIFGCVHLCKVDSPLSKSISVLKLYLLDMNKTVKNSTLFWSFTGGLISQFGLL